MNFDFEFTGDADYVSYGDMVLLRRCPICYRFVKADETINYNESNGPADSPNATCKKHGRVKMEFMGFY